MQVRPATVKDRNKIVQLIQFSKHIHRHLDWGQPIDLLGSSPFWVAEQHDHLVAALACPPDLPDTTWIRLYVVDDDIHVKDSWFPLWEASQAELSSAGEYHVAGIALEPWISELFVTSNFSNEQEVCMLAWSGKIPEISPSEELMNIRIMDRNDLEDVVRIDQDAFPKLWQYSSKIMGRAYTSSSIATVFDSDCGILGYQISTHNKKGGHLARLAVRPDSQNRGIGTFLVRDLLMRFVNQGVSFVTVNTQSDNETSLALYEKFDFHATGESYPVYQTHIDRTS